MNRMRNLFSLAHFRRLQWKLTFSYIWVTVGTLLAVGVLFVLGAIWFLGSAFLGDIILESVRTEIAPQIRPYLEQTPPDIEGLQTWMGNTLLSTQTVISVDSPPETQSDLLLGDNLRLSDGDSVLVVFDTNQELLAVVPEPTSPDMLDALPARFSKGQVIIDNALTGVTDIESLRGRFENSNHILAVPIQAENGDILGVVALAYILPSIWDNAIWRPLFQSILIFAIPLTMMAAFVGAIFGFLTSRGLTRRIQRISNAADAWSQGDFTVVDQDNSGDELGQLSRRLNQMAEQIQNLLDTREELATVEERNRLARDLHDSVKQQVFATTMQLGAARTMMQKDPIIALEHISEAEKLAKQSQQELSILIQELRPAALDDKGLVEALRHYVREWSQQTKIIGQVRVQGEQPLSLELEQALFRIAQEALSNVARHSQAQSVDVHLAWQDGTITLTIQDDGQGLSADLTEGVGLQSMRERTEALNGRFQINNHAVEGVTLTATLPTTS